MPNVLIATTKRLNQTLNARDFDLGRWQGVNQLGANNHRPVVRPASTAWWAWAASLKGSLRSITGVTCPLCIKVSTSSS